MSLLQFIARRLTSTHGKTPVQRRPVLLQHAEMKAVSGGGPKGTWLDEAAVVEGPKGTW